MEPSDDSPQLGSSPVDRDALAEAGVPLSEMLSSLDAQLDPDTDPAVLPREGWRVLSRTEYSVFVGAPDPAGAGLWFAGQAYLAHPERPLRVYDQAMALRRSPAERRAGLAMRWPSFAVDDDTVTDFAVDIVNTGAQRWMPDGDSFQTIGTFTRSDEGTYSFGYVASGTPAAVPLDPGEYTRVAVALPGEVWHDLEPGPVRLHAHSPALGLHAEPLALELTPERIALGRARSPRREPRQNRTARRRMLTEQIAAARSARAARPFLPEIAQIVVEADSDDEVIHRLVDLLDCSPDSARRIYFSPLHSLGPNAHERLEAEIAQYEATLADLADEP